MRYTYRLPNECFSRPITFRGIHIEWNSDPVVAGTKRLLCELFNDGHHVYARRFEDRQSTQTFGWLRYWTARPLTWVATSSKHSYANLIGTEIVQICLDGHFGATALVTFRYRAGCGKKYKEQYLVIREGQSIRVECAFDKVREKLLLTSLAVC